MYTHTAVVLNLKRLNLNRTVPVVFTQIDLKVSRSTKSNFFVYTVVLNPDFLYIDRNV